MSTGQLVLSPASDSSPPQFRVFARAGGEGRGEQEKVGDLRTKKKEYFSGFLQ